MRVELAKPRDVAPWMDLARQATPLFGPMPDLETVVQRKILQKQAYCVRSGVSDALSGGMLLGGSAKDFWIRWLVVSEESRRQGAGRKLVEMAILNTPPGATLSVDTFAEGYPGADAAGGLYRACGFKPMELWEKDQVVRQRYMRNATC